MIIVKLLDLKLYKNNNLKILKNNLAYLKNFDKIEFGIEEEQFVIIKKNNIISFIKENEDSVFNLIINNSAKAHILLKQNNLKFDINVDKFNYEYNDELIKLEYRLESDNEDTLIEITFKENEYND